MIESDAAGEDRGEQWKSERDYSKLSACRVNPAELGSTLCSNLACLVAAGVRHVSLPRSLAFMLDLGAAFITTATLIIESTFSDSMCSRRQDKWLSGAVCDLSTLNVECWASLFLSFVRLAIDVKQLHKRYARQGNPRRQHVEHEITASCC